MTQVVVVGLGGFLGAVLRYGLSAVVQRRFGESFPAGTLTVNLLGCFIMGICVFLIEEKQFFSPVTRGFVTLGILGSFTTFSTFGFETIQLLRDESLPLAVGNVLAHLVFGLLAVGAGWMAARALT